MNQKVNLQLDTQRESNLECVNLTWRAVELVNNYFTSDENECA